MCLGGGPSAPPPPPPPPAPPPPPRYVDKSVQEARTRERQRAALAHGRRATILTGGSPLTQEADVTSRKTLLGA